MQLLRKRDGRGVDADAQHRVIEQAAFQIERSFGEDPADFAAPDIQVVDPFDPHRPAGERGGPFHRPGGSDRRRRGDPGCLFPCQPGTEDHAQIQPTARWGEEGASPPSLSRGLAVGDDDGAVHRARIRQFFGFVVGGGQLGIKMYLGAEPCSGQKAADSRFTQPVVVGYQPVSPVGARFDDVPLLPQKSGSLPYGCTGYPQPGGKRTARQALSLRFQKRFQ